MNARKFLHLAAALLLAAPLSPAPAQTPAAASPIAPMKVGGDVLPPKLTHEVEPKYPHPIFHKAKPSLVLVRLTVSADGLPTDVHVLKTGGKDFDKAALKAVRQYRFEPSTLHGKPVSVAINVEVNFQI